MKRLVAVFILAILPALVCGGPNGPDTAEVSGVVRLEGQPLKGATIHFSPQAEGSTTSGRSSISMSDGGGRYRLEYSASRSGAVIGKHLVKITTQQTAGEDEDGNPTPAVEEKVPAMYNVEASANPEMIKDVKTGEQEINFDLQGGGKIIQRPKEDAG